jgi:SAM-dependent methyltransferase
MDPLNLPLIAGDDYLVAMSRRRADRAARAAFTRLATQLAPAGGRIFEFGCGPGTDAQLYASLGFAVTGYDLDPRMRSTFLRVCREALQRGQVAFDPAPSYAAFLAHGGCTGADLITANFAPLNLVADLAPLFAKFARLLDVRGRVLASVLNPYCLGDARYGWWWRHAPALLCDGGYRVGAGLFRRTPAHFAQAAAAQFRLTQVRAATGADRASPGWRRFTSQYLFLQFERL